MDLIPKTGQKTRGQGYVVPAPYLINALWYNDLCLRLHHLLHPGYPPGIEKP
jgi:hypothetical protein